MRQPAPSSRACSSESTLCRRPGSGGVPPAPPPSSGCAAPSAFGCAAPPSSDFALPPAAALIAQDAPARCCFAVYVPHRAVPLPDYDPAQRAAHPAVHHQRRRPTCLPRQLLFWPRRLCSSLQNIRPREKHELCRMSSCVSCVRFCRFHRGLHDAMPAGTGAQNMTRAASAAAQVARRIQRGLHVPAGAGVRKQSTPRKPPAASVRQRSANSAAKPAAEPAPRNSAGRAGPVANWNAPFLQFLDGLEAEQAVPRASSA